MPSEVAITNDDHRARLRYDADRHLPLLAGEVAWSGTGRVFHFIGSLIVVGLALFFVVFVLNWASWAPVS